jgi:uncharacterized repeat protein (TIGR01451 family)
MKFLNKPPQGWCFPLLVAAAYMGLSALQKLPVAAEEIVTIPNTATANFRNVPGGPLQPITSNQVTVTARVAPSGLEIVKSADRAAAEPGDSVIYRLLIRNTGSTTLRNIEVSDKLPAGFQFVTSSPRGSVTTNGATATVNLTTVAPQNNSDNRLLTFRYAGTLEPKQTLTIVYAALLSPDSVRGSGRNVATATGRTPTGGLVSSTASSYQVRIRPGILSDCGTIIGRVFVDKNFDGEQQPGEPGVPNAVIFMDDGNRITTDANGLYSLAYVVSGYHTGTLDLTSLPGYTLAPNLYRIEGNSSSRLVKLAPGSLVRMNFAVTPSFKESR